MAIVFTIPGCPVAKGRPRITTRGKFPRAFTPAKTRAAEETLAARAMEFRPRHPLTGPLVLDVTFVMPIPASMPKRDKTNAEIGNVPHTTRPDLDNLLKLLKDALNGVFWVDDKQIYDVTARKVYGPYPQTVISIAEAVSA